MCRKNEPYIVTLSYGFDKTKNAFYLHSALKGLKYEFLRENSSVCATIIDDKGYMINECAHAYRSLVVWGKMCLVGKGLWHGHTSCTSGKYPRTD